VVETGCAPGLRGRSGAMCRPRSASRRFTAGSSIVLLAAMFALPAASPAVAAIADCADPPPVFPIDHVSNGQTATGWTVLQGTTPESFTITLLGVLQDALAPGRDAILVKASGANIDAIGGMGPGFSGSPVYRNGQLVGSISYGLGGDSHYGALTAGQDLVNVLMEPTAPVAGAQRIQLSRDARQLIARDAGVQLDAVSASLVQLPLPLAVAGATDARMQEIQDRLSADGASVIAYRASSTSSATTVDANDPIEPGDVFAAALSYGSVTYAAVGTATIVCGDYVVAFGHYFEHSGGGPSAAMLDGDVVTTVPAGNDYWPFKLANVGDLQGVLEQDRLSGVRGIVGTTPVLTEVTSSITNLDTGAVTDMTTQVARKDWMPGITSDHVYYGLHAALDAHRGTTHASRTVTLHSRGAEYVVDLHDAYSGDRAIWGPASDTYAILRSIQRAEGPARIVSVHVDATVTEQRQVDTIRRVRTASTTSPVFADRNRVDVRPGDTLRVRVLLAESDTGAVHVAETTFGIPTTANGDGELEVMPGRPDFWLQRGLSLETTLDRLMSQPSSSDLLLQVRLGGTHRMTQHLPQPLPLNGGEGVALNLLRG